tara:strand:+ start:408 stop:590 length:183 start_codon:yes stop_codon:yes gene_type:complete
MKDSNITIVIEHRNEDDEVQSQSSPIEVDRNRGDVISSAIAEFILCVSIFAGDKLVVRNK